MTFQTITRKSLLAVIALMPMALAAGETTTVKQAALEKEGIELISQVEDVSRAVRNNTDNLLMHSRDGQISKRKHYRHLDEIKTLVNGSLSPALARLTEIQSELPSWHRPAIDKMLASAQALAADTNAAITNRNESGNQPAPLNAEYRALVASMDEHAESLFVTASAASDYAAAHRQAMDAGLIAEE